MELSLLFVLGQILGIARVGTAAYSFKAKSQDKNVFWKMISSGLYAAQYLALGFTSGAAVMGISAIRSLAFYILHKKNIKPKPSLLVAFTAISAITGLATWQNAWSLAPITAAAIVTYGQWQKDVKLSNFTLTAANLVLATCNLFQGAYVDFAGTMFISGSGIHGMVKDSPKYKERESIKKDIRKAIGNKLPDRELNELARSEQKSRQKRLAKSTRDSLLHIRQTHKTPKNHPPHGSHFL